MNLSQKQNQRIAKYLRDIDLQLGSLPPKAKEVALTRLRARIETDLRQFQDRPPEDREVEAILASCGTPGRVAAELLGKHSGLDSLTLSPERCWLGVCAGFARRFDMDARTVRAMAIALGLLTGPLALIAYVGIYLCLYVGMEDESVPPIDRARLLRITIGTLCALMALYAGSSILDALICGAYTRLAAHAPESLGDWRWLDRKGSGMFFWSLIVFLPIAALSGLPLAEGWDRTGKKIVQAGVAMYAMAICFGVASLVAGILLQFVSDFSV